LQGPRRLAMAGAAGFLAPEPRLAIPARLGAPVRALAKRSAAPSAASPN
jgi:hypothetical protein